MAPIAPKHAAPTRRGPDALVSRAGMVLLSFWSLLALALLLPSPLRVVLLGGGDRAKGGAASAPPNTPQAARRVTKASSAATAPSPGRQPTAVVGQAIEDPAHSLSRFARALAHDSGLVRVLHLGDSQIDLDHVSAEMRRRMQARYGDGGHGLLPAIRPWRWFRQHGIHYVAQGGTWRRYRLGGGARPDDRLGLGLLATESEGHAWSRIALEADTAADRLSLSYLAGPGHGRVTLYADQTLVARVDTAAPHVEARLARAEISTSARTLRVVTQGRVRLFGLVLEHKTAKGVTWENLPAVSARFHQLAELDATILAQQLRLRPAALVVFQFGANDAISYGDSIERYREQVATVLERWVGPARTACLVIGPLDQQERRGGRLQPRRAVDRVLAAQRAAAHRAGCSFWDARAAMGGPGSIVDWRARRLVRADLVHLNRAGAKELARLLDEALARLLDEALARGPRRDR